MPDKFRIIEGGKGQEGATETPELQQEDEFDRGVREFKILLNEMQERYPEISDKDKLQLMAINKIRAEHLQLMACLSGSREKAREILPYLNEFEGNLEDVSVDYSDGNYCIAGSYSFLQDFGEDLYDSVCENLYLADVEDVCKFTVLDGIATLRAIALTLKMTGYDPYKSIENIMREYLIALFAKYKVNPPFHWLCQYRRERVVAAHGFGVELRSQPQIELSPEAKEWYLKLGIDINADHEKRMEEKIHHRESMKQLCLQLAEKYSDLEKITKILVGNIPDVPIISRQKHNSLD